MFTLIFSEDEKELFRRRWVLICTQRKSEGMKKKKKGDPRVKKQIATEAKQLSPAKQYEQDGRSIAGREAVPQRLQRL